MPSYLHPGVYVEEIPSGSKPIEGVATSVAAFIGKATKGPVGEAKLIQNFTDYTNLYGDIASEGDAMGFAVQSFYMNGGKSAYICRLVAEGSAAASNEVDGQGDGSPVTGVLKVSASSEGEWGNQIYFRFIKPDQDSLTFDLEVGHQDKNKFVADEEFKGLSMREGDDNYALKVVNGNSAYVKLELGDTANPDEAAEQYQGATLTGGELDHTQDDYFKDFFATEPIRSLTLNLNGLGAKQIVLDGATLGLAGADHDVDGGKVATAIRNAVRALALGSPYKDFECAYQAHQFVLTTLEDDSNASLEIYEGDLAELLRIDPAQPAVLLGGPGVSSGAFSGGDYFRAITGEETLSLDIDNHGDIDITIDFDGLKLIGDNETDGRAVALAIQKTVQALIPSIASYKDFKCEYAYDSGAVAKRHFVLTSGNGSPRNSGLGVSGGTLAPLLALNAGTSEIIGRSVEQGTASVIPVQMLGTLDEGEVLAGGSENPAAANDFSKFYDKTLRKVRDVSIIVVPGEYWAEDGSGNSILGATLSHCQNMGSRMLILDPPEDLELDQAATVTKMALPSSTYSVLYYPWVKVANPFYHAEKNPNADKTVPVAPSAFAAGMWSRIDGKRGVWKAPAGLETGLNGASGLRYVVEEGEQDQLNPLGVNCLRNMPGGGRVIWGTRTLATKADPEWRYVPVRRTAIMIEQSIYEGIQWAVFEPNDHRLWSALRANIGNFMNGLFRAGAFQGEKASDAYFVRCGLGDTMTQGEIDAGQVIVIVGFAPLKPAEFVIVRIQQKVNQQ